MPTKIEWCDETWNPVVGCTKCSPGCANCYAERMAARLWRMGRGDYGSVLGIEDYKWNGEIFCREGFLDKPLHWKKPRRIFVCSMSDLFHPKVPVEFQMRVINVAPKCKQHIFQILTKRPERMKIYMTELYKTLEKFPKDYKPEIPYKNLHLGVSISNQAEADEKIPILLQIPAAVRWLSIEPMLGPIDLVGKDKSRMGKTGYLANYFTPFFCNDCSRHLSRPPSCVTQNCRYCGSMSTKEGKSISWVAVGCESGPRRRPCKLEWVRDIVKQCKVAGVPVFVKQIEVNGKVSRKLEEWPEDLQVQDYPK